MPSIGKTYAIQARQSNLKFAFMIQKRNQRSQAQKLSRLIREPAT